MSTAADSSPAESSPLESSPLESSPADSSPGRTAPTRRHRGATEGDDGAHQSVLRPGQTLARQKEQFGGVKIGSAFFGWLTATGTAVLLTALLTGAGTVVTLATGTSTSSLTKSATGQAATISVLGAIAVAAILLIAYYCGGYVAGRMARFNGVKQGVAVWVWAVVVAVVVAVLSGIAGSKYDVLSQLNSFPRIPVGQGNLTTAAVVTVVLALLVALVGAILGGLAGMHFHRKVDRVR